MIQILLTIFSLFLPTEIDCQPNPATALPVPDTIPFELTAANNIALQGIINEVDTVRLMFHTAASGVTLIEAISSRLKNMAYNGQDTVNSWGGESAGRYSQDNRLQIGRQQWNEVTIWENKRSGPTTDGKVGLFMFNDRIIELDFDAELMIIHEELPDLNETYTRLDMNVENGLPFIDGRIKVDGKEYTNRFLVHTGYGGAVLLDDQFVALHQLADQLEIMDESVLKDSYGNELKTLKAILPAFAVGGTEFKQIPVSFFSGAIGRQKISVLGGDVWKRFDLLFDLQDSSLYLRPNELVHSAVWK